MASQKQTPKGKKENRLSQAPEESKSPQEVRTLKRKIVQISTEHPYIFALCDDGTLWRNSALPYKWQKEEDVPQPYDDIIMLMTKLWYVPRELVT